MEESLSWGGEAPPTHVAGACLSWELGTEPRLTSSEFTKRACCSRPARWHCCHPARARAGAPGGSKHVWCLLQELRGARPPVCQLLSPQLCPVWAHAPGRMRRWRHETCPTSAAGRSREQESKVTGWQPLEPGLSHASRSLVPGACHPGTSGPTQRPSTPRRALWGPQPALRCVDQGPDTGHSPLGARDAWCHITPKSFLTFYLGKFQTKK